MHKPGGVLPVRGLKFWEEKLKPEKRWKALFQTSAPAQPSGEEIVLKSVWEAKHLRPIRKSTFVSRYDNPLDHRVIVTLWSSG